jgi:FkbM family methyltransferase
MPMSAVSILRNVGNRAYTHAFPIYRVCYSAFKAYTDRAERQVLKSSLFPGAIVVDAGANIGVYSRFLSGCVGPTGVVYSFEPEPENFKRLQSATRTLSNVHLCRAALGERSGTTKLYVSDKLNVDHRTYPAETDSRRCMKIDVVALDDYFKPGQRIDLIKADIQGYELFALRGATRVMAENTDAKLLLEFWPYGLKQAGASWKDLIAMLEAKDLKISQLTKAGLVPFRPESVRENPEWYVNLFATK